ncbi:hypothetical protein BJX66DRAFT_256832 [Aspergillus keveii]|uniref:Uncharacterized protein n=1 Tax=Aspergillus keveii TaxID=714993 RepID=A0ABR4GJP8_9EURO
MIFIFFLPLNNYFSLGNSSLRKVQQGLFDPAGLPVPLLASSGSVRCCNRRPSSFLQSSSSLLPLLLLLLLFLLHLIGLAFFSSLFAALRPFSFFILIILFLPNPIFYIFYPSSTAHVRPHTTNSIQYDPRTITTYPTAIAAT